MQDGWASIEDTHNKQTKTVTKSRDKRKTVILYEIRSQLQQFSLQPTIHKPNCTFNWLIQGDCKTAVTLNEIRTPVTTVSREHTILATNISTGRVDETVFCIVCQAFAKQLNDSHLFLT